MLTVRLGVCGTAALVALDALWSAIGTVEFNGFTKLPGYSAAEFSENYKEHPIFNIFEMPQGKEEIFASIGKIAVAGIVTSPFLWRSK